MQARPKKQETIVRAHLPSTPKTTSFPSSAWHSSSLHHEQNHKREIKIPTTTPLHIAIQSKQKSTPASVSTDCCFQVSGAFLFFFLGPRDCLPISAGRSPGLPAPGGWHLADPARQTRPVRLVCETSSQALLAAATGAAPPQAQRPVSRLHFWRFPLPFCDQQQREGGKLYEAKANS